MWKKIKGYENYSVSDSGLVRNDKSGKSKSSYQNPATGYMVVDLYKDNQVKHATVHRLVAEAFLPNPDRRPTVDHINGDRTDNRVANLRWATYSENNSRFSTTGVRAQKIKATLYDEERKARGGGHVRWLAPLQTKYFDSISACAGSFGCSIGNISLMLKRGEIGRRGLMRGWKFEYVDGSRIELG